MRVPTARNRPLLALLAGLPLMACAASAPRSPMPQTLTLDEGSTVEVPGIPLRLRFVGKTTDSRCPTGARCVWAGEAIGEFQLLPGAAAPVAFALTTSTAGRRDAVHSVEQSGYRFTLLDMQPAPELDKPVAGGHNRAVLGIDKAGAPVTTPGPAPR